MDVKADLRVGREPVSADNPVPVYTGGQTPVEFDYVGYGYPDAVTEVFSLRNGGSGGTLVRTITVVYVDSTKERPLSTTIVTHI